MPDIVQLLDKKGTKIVCVTGQLRVITQKMTDKGMWVEWLIGGTNMNGMFRPKGQY